MFMQTVLESLLNRFTDWLGQTEGALAFGTTVGVPLVLLVGWLGKRAIAWLCSRASGDHLPVRSLVTRVASSLNDLNLWAALDGHCVSNASSGLTLGAKFFRVGVGGDNLFDGFNRKERKLLDLGRRACLAALAEATVKLKEREAETLLHNAVSLMGEQPGSRKNEPFRPKDLCAVDPQGQAGEPSKINHGKGQGQKGCKGGEGQASHPPLDMTKFDKGA